MIESGNQAAERRAKYAVVFTIPSPATEAYNEGLTPLPDRRLFREDVESRERNLLSLARSRNEVRKARPTGERTDVDVLRTDGNRGQCVT